jgi:hypothetical protein
MRQLSRRCPGILTGLLAGPLACGGQPEAVRRPSTDAGATDSGEAGTINTCRRGEYLCNGQVARRCDGKGGFSESVGCDQQCMYPFGCVVCTPGEGSCANGIGHLCLADGSRMDTFDCDPAQGMRCEPDGCRGSCAPAELSSTYLGCEYYPTVMLNPVWHGFDFAVAVANAGGSAANLLVTRGSTTVQSSSIEPGEVAVLKLPWVDELKGGEVDACQNPPDPGATRVVPAGAYRLRTDQPVTVYQLSPLEYRIDPPPADCPVGASCSYGDPSLTRCFAYSADASLLLPVTALTGNYTATSWPATRQRAGVITVTATRDTTQVDVLGVGSFAAGAGISANGVGTVTLNRGDVLELVTDATVASGAFGADLSGTRVRATEPVQVLGGHSCGNVPEPLTDACDHLEQVMLPSEVLGSDYLVTMPGDLPEELVVRVAAIRAGTHIEFDPPVAPATTLGPSEPPLELRATTDFRVTSDEPVSVTAFQLGQGAVSGGVGDPSMTVAVPSEQFRKQYLFVASTTFDENWINVVAPTGATITLDGQPLLVTDFVPIGTSPYAVVKVRLARTDVHTIEGDAAFGITVYGYGQYTSYMYPGGLDLKRLTPSTAIVY